MANIDIFNIFNASGLDAGGGASGLSSSLNTTYGPNWLRPNLLQFGRWVKFSGQIDFYGASDFHQRLGPGSSSHSRIRAFVCMVFGPSGNRSPERPRGELCDMSTSSRISRRSSSGPEWSPQEAFCPGIRPECVPSRHNGRSSRTCHPRAADPRTPRQVLRDLPQRAAQDRESRARSIGSGPRRGRCRGLGEGGAQAADPRDATSRAAAAGSGRLRGSHGQPGSVPRPGRCGTSQSGPVGVHRLNRTEYTNAIRDLFGLTIDSRSLLPEDEPDRQSFDNIASVLSVSPALLERYLTAARR